MTYTHFVHEYVTKSALATIVCIVALASPAPAKVIYHSAHIVISAGTYNLDLNGDGIVDFSITSEKSFGSCTGIEEVKEGSASGNGTILGPLSLGDPIGPDQTFVGGGILEYDRRIQQRLGKCENQSGGPWLGIKSGYLGFSLQVAGQTYYGWARLINKDPSTVVLVGYAYEDTPVMAIGAGETRYVQFIPSSLNFGSVTKGSTVSGSASLINWGTNTLLISKAALSGLNAADFASENGNPPCGGIVAAGATCALTFTFTPSIAGNETAIYSVYDDGGASPQKLQLKGTGR